MSPRQGLNDEEHDSWVEYRKLILATLERFSEELHEIKTVDLKNLKEELSAEISKVEEEMDKGFDAISKQISVLEKDRIKPIEEQLIKIETRLKQIESSKKGRWQMVAALAGVGTVLVALVVALSQLIVYVIDK